MAVRWLDHTALVWRHTDILEAEAVRVGAPPDGHDHDVGINCLAVATLGWLHAQFQLALQFLDACHFHAQAEFEALFLECLLGFLGDFRVCGRQDSVEIFNHGHFRAETRPD